MVSALNDAITTAQGLDETDYSSASWAVVEAALNAAIAVRDNVNSTTTQYLNATQVLADAMTALIPETVATPVADPVAGEVQSGDFVTLTCETENATIRFTMDESEPDEESDEYTEPIEITVATTIKAKAFKGAMTASGVLTAAYTIAT